MNPNELYETLKELHHKLRQEKKEHHQRSVSFGDYLTERHERAAFHGFGEGSTVYDNVLILGDVCVGKNVWIGPGVILDGSGGLTIGDYCSISAGVQIYSHDTVAWSLSLGKAPVVRAATHIGSGVYIGPNAIVQMGVKIGDRCVIGALSLVQGNIPSGSKAYGCPAKTVGSIEKKLFPTPLKENNL